MWTKFWDMHSGGKCKEKPYSIILIEAPEEEAKVIFYNRFRHNPERVTCTCCGRDYDIESNESLEQLTGYRRRCKWDISSSQYIEKPAHVDASYKTVQDFIELDDVLAIKKESIKDSNRTGIVPVQGYVWAGDEDDSY